MFFFCYVQVFIVTLAWIDRQPLFMWGTGIVPGRDLSRKLMPGNRSRLALPLSISLFTEVFRVLDCWHFLHCTVPRNGRKYLKATPLEMHWYWGKAALDRSFYDAMLVVHQKFNDDFKQSQLNKWILECLKLSTKLLGASWRLAACTNTPSCFWLFVNKETRMMDRIHLI